ncbi:chromate reductase [Arachidicoccus rhizosphaerae]|uniref:Chromate reductase n=1 Tax=Arachidicoccus rhizosphaerae TaxID=551991 RepID=A0A1H3YD71_9BACT|nr:NAD(P)H-dependent oxidoreductase [Arachidicoccus rhizosphaerae]SEA09506.1 chromate reductase [Arachidicoccus rhizosphaerae]
MSEKKIGLFVGSLRKGSYSKVLAHFIEGLSSEVFSYKMIEIGDLPLYNQDFDDHGPVPDSYTRFRDAVKLLDGFIFITPEYNRSVPAVLKNALDVGSRPYGHSVWSSKPGAIISDSPGIYGGFGANHHLRQSLVFLNVFPMQQPESYLAKINSSINEQAEITSDSLKDTLVSFVEAFEKWVKTVQA